MVDKIWYNMEELIGGSEERVLIETYWNVKFHTPVTILYPTLVLIETYWNVKIFITREAIFEKYVLIETYWNVKTHCPQGIKNVSSINRNILECKENSYPLRITQTKY